MSIDRPIVLHDGVVDRLDGDETIVSSSDHGMKRLRISAALRLRVGDKFTLIVPPTDAKQYRSSIKPRNDTTGAFRKIILSTANTRNMSKEDKETYFEKNIEGAPKNAHGARANLEKTFQEKSFFLFSGIFFRNRGICL